MRDWEDVENDGWEYIQSGDFKNAERCAREVLEREPNAIDSYVILSRTAQTQAEKISLLREGSRIGDELFEKEVLAAPNDNFPFWGFLETRPYMRALHSLSLALVADPRDDTLEEAVAIWRKLFAICPNDNLGVRFLISEYEENGDVELDDF
jgi:tetratricopeptide (TPR) repeat protein